MSDAGREEAVRVGVTPTGTISLLRSYRRVILERLEPYVPDSCSPACLHPGLVWEVSRPFLASGAAHTTGSAVDVDRVIDLSRNLAPAGFMPPLEHVGLDESMRPAWCQWGVHQLMSDIQQARSTGVTEFSDYGTNDHIENLEAARAVLRRVWPEAALEMDLLVRVIVHVYGGAFRSATLRQTFGAIYLGAASLESPTAAYEAILHETGHHALYLRNVFEPFVTNGEVMMSHPLRPEPRPVAGAVHAAHVLARMTYGLALWARTADAPAEVAELHSHALRRLTQTIAALKPVARWTDRGRLYFDDLLRWEENLSWPDAG